jgi:CheY-like chemotaxis protein
MQQAIAVRGIDDEEHGKHFRRATFARTILSAGVRERREPQYWNGDGGHYGAQDRRSRVVRLSEARYRDVWNIPYGVCSVSLLRGSETVLIADDHDSIREMVRQTLASLGYGVLCAANGKEALRLCEQNTPQIAVLDVVMPRLGGTATADKLLVRFPDLRVIFTSGYSRDRDERTANLSQASYLQKPYSATRLGRLVRDILDG